MCEISDLNSEVMVCSTRGGRGLWNIFVRGSKGGQTSWWSGLFEQICLE